MQQPALVNSPELFSNPKEKMRLVNSVKKVQFAATLFCNNLLHLYKSSRTANQSDDTSPRIFERESLSICYDMSLGLFLEEADELGLSYADCKKGCYVGEAPVVKKHDELNECSTQCKREFQRYHSSLCVYYGQSRGVLS